MVQPQLRHQSTPDRGQENVGLEIAEQLGWDVPDWVAMSVGDGCTIAGAWKAFRELKVLGLIDRTPRMLGVQVAAPSLASIELNRRAAPLIGTHV
jgi:threonine synthase